MSKLGLKNPFPLFSFNDPDADLVLDAFDRKGDMLEHGFFAGFRIQGKDEDLLFIDPFSLRKGWRP